MRSSSRLSCLISAASSAGDGTRGSAEADAGAIACAPGAVPQPTARQLRSIEGWMPSSMATCINGRPLLSSKATASRLNSSVNVRRVFVIQHLLAPCGTYQRCPRKPGRITSSFLQIRSEPRQLGLPRFGGRLGGLAGQGFG
jgi:hypothetical protein